MRLLLWIAAITALTWAKSAEKNLQPHPLSPVENDPTPFRAKRQAYQVYVDGDSTVSIDKGGPSETGPWGVWTAEECSRTCGGGVQTEKRQCNGDCTGPSVRYVSCNIEECTDGKDFRAEQCEKHNDDVLDGNYHKWLPYKGGKNKCELLCKPETGSFYYKWEEKVIDGTRCDSKSNDICVDGVCLPIGCDKKLGSAKVVDKCGVCDGNGSTCKTIEGFFDERNLSPGYHNVIRLPAGATGIDIREARASSNNLALKNSSDYFYLNGNSMLQEEQGVEAAGTIFDYDDAKPERLTAKGPLTEDVIVALMFRKGNKDAAIKYSFSIPLDDTIQFMYKPSEWSACSVTCGKGVITRTPYCIDNANQARVSDDLCDDNNATKPEFEKPCMTVDCEAEWFEGEWEDCSQTCGKLGEQYRVVYCQKIFADGRKITVDDSNCTATRPAVRQACNRFACPEWQAGPWSACSEKCGDAHQFRSVTCRSEKEGEEGKLLPAEACDDKNLETQRSCNLGPCEGLKFYTSDWKLCSKCNDTEETREVTCKDNMGRAYPLEKCLTGDVTDIPIDTRTCATQQPCIYEWTASQWSKCSTECGHGHKTRRTVCAIHQLGDLDVVDESHCQGEKPSEKEECTNEEKCTGTWYSGPWSKCTEECDGGEQERMTVCLNYDKKPTPTWCDESEKPEEKQKCNEQACPTCFDSEFGCCPDNSTFATGEFNLGCSNCSLSEFGCCADNYTQAIGPNSKGCEEFVELVEEEGSGDAEDLVLSTTEEPAKCQVQNDNGDMATVDCAIANATTVDDVDILGNGTEGNGTLHCSKTEFGCCPDWFTPAEGKNNEGCGGFVQGVCNSTQYGCCPDGVTLARGSNLEGCGEPSCAGSLYGCCKDRRTIAFGPHYAGCERSSFPCELAPFGCCPDGETAALGKNGTGCGENCLTTKYGCCPDGNTTAKGHHNEGCGCIYAQYGCCPDGKTSAKGAGFYGCPESCAQSQFGCCPDGKTSARGAHKEGCPCQYTRYGCCPDGETTALGPKNDGCNICRYAKHGCCPDGETKALGKDYAGCPSTTLAPFLLGGTVAPTKIQSCSLQKDQGTVCAPGYKLVWFYDSVEGQCSQFWYGGCDGNDNRFATKEQCETICVEPPGKGRCYLPKIEGPMRCDQPVAKYWYDHTVKQCTAFWWRGCLGNSNNFDTWDECSTFCKDIGPITTPAPALASREEPREAPRPVPQQQSTDEVDVRVAPADIERQRQAMPTLEEVCRSNQDAGPCFDYSDYFYYNAYSGVCEKFVYGGCGGNRNRFTTAKDCQDRCGFLSRDRVPQQLSLPQQADSSVPVVPATSVRQPFVQSKSRESCHLNMDVGRCKGSFEKWYHEIATGTCVSFQYSGCGGNANRFGSREECQELCVRSSDSSNVVIDGPAGANAICEEPKDTGPCNTFVTKWYFNNADGTCNRFHYGGCEGTKNRFDNEQDCKAACSNHRDACTLPQVKGPCSGKHSFFYFNTNSKKCESFVYGGCLGNTNRFATIEECETRCPNEEQVSLTLPINDQPYNGDRCSMPKSTGHCKAAIDMYYFDSSIRKCMQFYYGGCGGNENRFDTLDECQSICLPTQQALTLESNQIAADEPRVDWQGSREAFNDDERSHQVERIRQDARNEYELQRINDPIKSQYNQKQPQTSFDSTSILPELCQLPEQRGSCFDNLLRWRYDSERSSCVSFMYSGCDQNANFFTSEEACNRGCGRSRSLAVCQLPKSEGNCDLAVAKWYFDQTNGKCRMMMWTGCGGNDNRFSSRSECDMLCKEETNWGNEDDVCSLSRSSGPCDDAISSWYYDKDMGECRQFTYSGCRGNGNRFMNKMDCEKKCATKMERLMYIDSHTVCRLPFVSGPCDNKEEKWTFNIHTSQCEKFIYGGCNGNENRFDSQTDCMSACSSEMKIIKKTAAVKVHKEGPYKAGHEIILSCETDARPIIWTKDDEIVIFSERVQEMNDFTRLHITSAIPSDSGIYQCAFGEEGIKSEAVNIKVIDEMPSFHTGSCIDQGSKAVCSLIVKTNLCSKKRYGSFCCKTCKSQGL